MLTAKELRETALSVQKRELERDRCSDQIEDLDPDVEVKGAIEKGRRQGRISSSDSKGARPKK